MDQPLVTAILPTRGRRKFARQALDCFQQQTYANKEIVIVDDADEPSFDDTLDIPAMHRILTPTRSIAEKRNIACSHAWGELIVHFDSDDYSAPTRIEDQVRLLLTSGKAVAGFHSMLFYVERGGRVYQYQGNVNYAIGTSLMYRKYFWEMNPFRAGKDHPNVGEDNLFQRAARDVYQLVSVPAGALMVARIHSDNTSTKEIHGTQLEYRLVSPSILPPGFPCTRDDSPI